MVLATIDPHRKSTPRFTNSPSVALIGLVLTEIQQFKNVKIYDHLGSWSRCVRQRPDGHTFLSKLWHFQIAVSSLPLSLLTPNLGIL